MKPDKSGKDQQCVSGQGRNTTETSCAHVNDFKSVELDCQGKVNLEGCSESYVSSVVPRREQSDHFHAAADPSPELFRGAPVASLLPQEQHVRPQPGSASQGAPSTWRTGAFQLDQGGAQASPTGAVRRGHEPDQSAVGQERRVRVPDVVQEAASSHGEAEGGPGHLHRAGAEDQQRGQVHCEQAGNGGAAAHPGDHQARSQGSSGLRQIQCQHISTGPGDQPQLLQVDHTDSSRGIADLRLPPEEVCAMDRSPDPGRDDPGEVQGPQVLGSQGGEEGAGHEQLRGLSDSQPHQVGEPDGGHGRDDAVHEVRAGRSQECQGGDFASEEGRQGQDTSRVRQLVRHDSGGEDRQPLSSDSPETAEYEQGLEESDIPAKGLSASQHLSQLLSVGKARVLEDQAWSIVPQLFEGVVNAGRTVLLEVACSEGSLLSSQIQEVCQNPSAALRCSYWNGCDLSTDSGVRLILKRLDLEQPAHVWLSPPCGPYSPLQNVNARSESQKQELCAKREEAMRMYVGSCIIIHACVQRGIHVTFELSERCQAWRLPILSSLQQKYSLYSAVSKGCRVGLHDRKGVLMQKGWRILTAHKRSRSC